MHTTALASLFQAVLPPEAVVAEASALERLYLRNVTALKRRVPLALLPSTEEQVARLLAVANAHGIRLYPFSTGRNWGLGSRLPVVDDCVLVDLSRMDRILAVDESFGYAIIEPGVTQMQLATHLRKHHPSLTLNLTGSFAYTSIVGNVLERGDGAYARIHDLLGVCGFLGNGAPFQVGGLWEHMATSLPSHYLKWRAGPDLTGLFSQSNFAIVTRMAFRLMPRPERRSIFWGTVADTYLEQVVDAFDRLGRQGVVNPESVNLGYANRFVQAVPSLQLRDDVTEQVRAPGGSDPSGHAVEAVWHFYALVSGTARMATAALEDLREVLDPLCCESGALDPDTLDEARPDLPEFLYPLSQPLMGLPDTESIKLVYNATETPLPSEPHELDVDQTPFGMKCYVGTVPPRGWYARQAAEIVRAACAEFDLNIKLSIFGDGRTLVTVHFRADDERQVCQATQCEAALWQRMVAAGFPPYRASIDQMDRLVNLSPAYFQLVARIKAALDPQCVIAPGRYCPSEPLREVERPHTATY
jgi:4-cresol dehydrogenase (hydroxylating)